MTGPFNISIADYHYSLPEDRIAKYPLAERDASKLLIYKNGDIHKDTYEHIAQYVPDNALLIFNNTKVVEARLLFQKPSGGTIEIFCLEPHEQYADITTAMQQQGKVWWKCLVGGASKWKAGQILSKAISHEEKTITLHANYIDKTEGAFIIELSWEPADLSFAELLHHAGLIPLPPYIKRLPEETDKERYQTVYAQTDGSVAAPTAGLHFTNQIFGNLRQKNIEVDYVTLHVGAGTFKPVKTETVGEHDMHAEWIDVHIDTIKKIRENLDNNIIAVGTTSLRTIESLYWMGVKQLAVGSWQQTAGSEADMFLSQWEVYDPEKNNIPADKALAALIEWMELNKMERLVTKTQILIAPGYSFKVIKALITNFHQPQSTLLLLVAALIGDDWKKVYRYAMDNNFRFLSYGDGSLLWKST